MGTTDQVHVVLLQESRDNVGAKSKRDTSVIFAPPSDILIGVGPQQVTEKTAVGNLGIVSTKVLLVLSNLDGS